MPVEVHIREDGPTAVVELVGALDSSLPAETRCDIVDLIKPGCHLVFDLSGLVHLSGTGLRMLLQLIRAVQAVGGTVAGVAIPQDLKDIASAAGFIELFQQAPAVVPLVMPSLPHVARIDVYPTHHHAGFALRPGFPLPFGATRAGPRGQLRGLFPACHRLHPCPLRARGRGAPRGDPIPAEFRVGDVFAMTVFDLDPDSSNTATAWTDHLSRAAGHRFDQSQILLDPMARAVAAETAGGRSGPIAPVPLPRPPHAGRLRLGGRPPARPADGRPGHLRDARPRLHAQPVVRPSSIPAPSPACARRSPT